jgi:hypothetical protein
MLGYSKLVAGATSIARIETRLLSTHSVELAVTRVLL